MTPHQTLAVAARLFAIWLALYLARELFWFISSDHQKNHPYDIAVMTILGLFGVLLLVVLWFFPKSIARGLLTLSTDVAGEPSPPRMWLAVGSSLIGLWLVASAVPALLRNSWVMYAFGSEYGNKAALIDSVAYYIVQCLVGAALIFGANGIAKLIWWARTTGTAEPSNNVVESDAEEARAPHHGR
jgi:hypothetical protein